MRPMPEAEAAPGSRVGAAPHGLRTGLGVGFAGWALAYAVLVTAGRVTAVEDTGASLVWPAAGAGLLWLLAQPTRARALACLVAMAVELAALMTLTGAGATLTAVGVASGLLQAAVGVLLIRRWCPGLLGAGGVASVHEPWVLVRGSGAVVLATLVGAVVGSGSLALLGAELRGVGFLDWWGRNLTGLFFVGAVGHLLWEWAWGRRTATSGVRTRDASQGEAIALVVVSLAAYSVVFLREDLPLAFALVPLGVWSAARLTTLAAVLLTAVLGSLAVALTLSGHGPFRVLPTAETEALVTQAFLLVLLLTVLAVATGRDERAVLLAQLEQSHRETAQRAELLDAMTEAMTEGLVVVDAAGQVVRTNAAARRLMKTTAVGYSASTADYEIRRPDGSVLPVEEHPLQRALHEGRVVPHDLMLRTGLGPDRVLEVTAAALTGGAGATDRIGALVVYRDVTEERDRSNRLAEFAEVAAHDLRSPLTALRGWLDVAVHTLQARPDLAPDEALLRRALDRALMSTGRMADLITDLLAQASAEGGDLDLEPVDLAGASGLVAQVAAHVGHQADVEVGALPRVLADREMLRQVLTNLIGNAVKYVAPGLRPHVVVSGVRRGDRVVLELTDNGIGIPDADRGRVFDRFHRAHADDPAYVGTGLGLAICRTIVERHDGTIACHQAASGTGSRFVLDLPAA